MQLASVPKLLTCSDTYERSHPMVLFIGPIDQ